MPARAAFLVEAIGEPVWLDLEAGERVILFARDEPPMSPPILGPSLSQLELAAASTDVPFPILGIIVPEDEMDWLLAMDAERVNEIIDRAAAAAAKARGRLQ